MGRVTGSLLVLMICGLVAAGCGGSSSKNDAVSKCKDAAKSISNSTARQAAESACSAAGTIATSASSAASTAATNAASTAATNATNQVSTAADECQELGQAGVSEGGPEPPRGDGTEHRRGGL